MRIKEVYMKNRVSLSGLLCIPALLCFCVTGCATHKVHPEFKSRHANINKIAVMAPQIDAYLLTFKGDKNRLDYVCAIMDKAMVDGMEYAFSQKGYEIKKLDVGAAAQAADPGLKTATFNINKMFDKAVSDIKSGKQSKFTYSVGPDINLFADRSGSDVIIFIRGLGLEKSDDQIAGEVVKGVAVAVASAMVGVAYTPRIQASSVAMEVAVVDGDDGAILWYNCNMPAMGECSPRNNRQVSNLTRYLVLAFPNRAKKEDTAKNTKTDKADDSVHAAKDVSVAPVIISPVAR